MGMQESETIESQAERKKGDETKKTHASYYPIRVYTLSEKCFRLRCGGVRSV